MRTHYSPHRYPLLHDIEPELPMLVIGACALTCTIIAVYLYAALQ